jgi:capsular exopolysaccharide synthesis family protein
MNPTHHDAEAGDFDYFRVISKRRRIVVLVTLFGISIMAAYAFLSAPVYQATALVSVDKVGSDVAAPSGEKQDSDESYFETQFKLITSETQMRRVYDDLKLREVPEFSDGLRSLNKAVSVMPVPRARLASINAESTDPRLAAAIAGALAHAFVEKNLDNQLFMSKTELDALQTRTKDPDARLVVESLPAVVNNKLIQDIKTQIFNSEAELANLRSKYTSSYPAVRALMSRLDAMRRERDHEMDNIVGSLKTELSGQLRANNVRVVDEPSVPEYPVRPRQALALFLGLAGGLALGVFAALMLETFDQTVRTHHDVEKKLGLSSLGLIPLTRRKRGAKVYAPLVSPDVSPSSEAFRNLRTVVDLAHKMGNDPFLLVTSTVQSEGKSFVATNLAVALSQLGQRVLIVDGDLRRPNQHLNLSSTAKTGLSEFLISGTAEDGALAYRTELPHLEFVPCGARPNNPAELLNAEHMARFVAWARARYTRVIVDCPPVFPVSDVLLWGRHVNSAIFVSRSGRTRVPLIQTACARLRTGGVKILGGVVNGVVLGTTRYADGRYAEIY